MFSIARERFFLPASFSSNTRIAMESGKIEPFGSKAAEWLLLVARERLRNRFWVWYFTSFIFLNWHLFAVLFFSKTIIEDRIEVVNGYLLGGSSEFWGFLLHLLYSFGLPLGSALILPGLGNVLNQVRRVVDRLFRLTMPALRYSQLKIHSKLRILLAYNDPTIGFLKLQIEELRLQRDTIEAKYKDDIALAQHQMELSISRMKGFIEQLEINNKTLNENTSVLKDYDKKAEELKEAMKVSESKLNAEMHRADVIAANYDETVIAIKNLYKKMASIGVDDIYNEIKAIQVEAVRRRDNFPLRKT